MSEPLLRALSRMRALVLDDAVLVRAVASGRQRGKAPRWRRAELRYVDVKAGRRLQVVTFDATQSFTANHEPGDAARDAVDALLDEPFGSWHVETVTETHELRVSKVLEATVTTTARTEQVEPERTHDRVKPRLLPEDHPVLVALGISDADGRVKPSRQAKYRQVEEFLRLLEQSVDSAVKSGKLRTPTPDDPLRVVDLGCGNAYLTFAAQAYLTERGLPVTVTGVDTKAQSLAHGEQIAAALGAQLLGDTQFVQGSIGDAEVDPAPEVVLALHACDTATDDALSRAVGWQASLVLAAPCCHHDVAAQLRRAPTPAPYAMLTRDGILRERLADTLTDGLRAAVLRLEGYRVDVVEFVGSEHTPRNTLIRAVRTGAEAPDGARADLDALTSTWRVTPRLVELLAVSRA